MRWSRNGSSVRLHTIPNSSACENVRTVSAKISVFDGLGMSQVYFLQTISNSSACESVRTFPAKINDFDGLGMGRVYFCKRFQIAQLVKM